ncbi:YecH family metal-binding protein [Dongshaea marina]|uniref:YecH family metal-binding protein n=1 Tax=Dongshaea marina TaxID=2047966 RepID=UPI000D3EA6BE|nr:YecH family metal-binding protein [Dongshaea marina]
MSQSIHGHDVIAMIRESHRSYPREELIALVEQEFGEDTRFHTCKLQDLTATQLIDFLIERKKLQSSPAGLSIDPEQICNHDH